MKRVLLAGLLAGTLDIISALTDYYISNGKTPFQPLLRFVASGFFGKAAYTNGAAVPVWGMLFHYCIAMSFTLLFFILYPRVKWMRISVWLTALLYGLFMWSFMRFIVLPLSNIPSLPPLVWWKAAKSVLILVAAIGIPLSVIASRQLRN